MTIAPPPVLLDLEAGELPRSSALRETPRSASTCVPAGCCALGDKSVSARSFASTGSTDSVIQSSSFCARLVDRLDRQVLSRSTARNILKSPRNLLKSTSKPDLSRFNVPTSIGFSEAEDRLQGLCRKTFTQRIDLEIKMVHTLPKFWFFFLAFSLFLLIEWVEYNPENFAQTHRTLRSQFKLDSDLFSIEYPHDMVMYLGKFARAADILNPLSIYHWCPENDTSTLSPSISNRILCRSKRRRPNANIASSSVRRLMNTSEEFGDNVHVHTQMLKSQPQQDVGQYTPHTHELEILLPRPSPIHKPQPRAHGHAQTSGVVGVAINGVLLVHQHYHADHAQPITWHFDDCGGHGDADGWYHYHFPPSCLLTASGDAAPSMTSWWAKDEPEAYWPVRAAPSPLLGFALDGHPIYGPYGPKGQLMTAVDLDECHGLFLPGANGSSEYRYYWLTSFPFLPPCFSGKSVALDLNLPPGEPCSNTFEGVPTQVSKSLATVDERTGSKIMKTSGCPDHTFFRGPTSVSTSELEERSSEFARSLRSDTADNSTRSQVDSPKIPSRGGRPLGGKRAGSKSRAAGGAHSSSPKSFGKMLSGARVSANATGNTSHRRDVKIVAKNGVATPSGPKSNANQGWTMRPKAKRPLYGGQRHRFRKQLNNMGLKTANVSDIFTPCAAGADGTKKTPPTFYRRHHPFTVKSAGVLPPLLWQTRLEAVDCESKFVNMFNEQGVNNMYNAPLDAPRKDPIIRCRGKKSSSGPHLGQRSLRLGSKDFYSVFLSESIVPPMLRYDWIDDLTDEVTLAMLVFTPGLENLSLLRLRFRFEDSGRVVSSFVLTTHSSFRDRPDFNLWLGLNIACLVVAAWRLRNCVRSLWKETWLVDGINLRRFDAVLAFVFLLFVVFSFVRRMFLRSVLDEVQPLLDSFYAVADVSDAQQVEDTQTKYLLILQSITERYGAEERLKMTAYVLIVIGILRLIAYMSVHPRIALLSQTVVAASDSIFHFSLVFGFISASLAWLACWSFGPDKDLFSTLQYSMLTQLKMIMGEFPFDDPWKESPLERVWYVCYAVLIFFLAVNIFLAIIVEAFVVVKRKVADEVLVERSIMVDFISLIRYELLTPSLRWPSHLSVARHLHTTRHFQGPVTSKELKQSRFLDFSSRHEAQQYMDFYYSLLGDDILAKQGREFLEVKRQQKETHKCLVVLFNVSEEQMVQSARKIQQHWQSYLRQTKMQKFVRSSMRTFAKSSRNLSSLGENLSSAGSQADSKLNLLPTLLTRGFSLTPSSAAGASQEAEI